MDAKTALLDYARQHNDGKVYTDEQFCGKMVTEGIVINRGAGSMVVAIAKREGRTIIVSEISSVPTLTGTRETTTEIFRVDV